MAAGKLSISGSAAFVGREFYLKACLVDALLKQGVRAGDSVVVLRAHRRFSGRLPEAEAVVPARLWRWGAPNPFVRLAPPARPDMGCLSEHRLLPPSTAVNAYYFWERACALRRADDPSWRAEMRAFLRAVTDGNCLFHFEQPYWLTHCLPPHLHPYLDAVGLYDERGARRAGAPVLPHILDRWERVLFTARGGKERLEVYYPRDAAACAQFVSDWYAAYRRSTRFDASLNGVRAFLVFRNGEVEVERGILMLPDDLVVTRVTTQTVHISKPLCSVDKYRVVVEDSA